MKRGIGSSLLYRGLLDFVTVVLSGWTIGGECFYYGLSDEECVIKLYLMYHLDLLHEFIGSWYLPKLLYRFSNDY